MVSLDNIDKLIFTVYSNSEVIFVVYIGRYMCTAVHVHSLLHVDIAAVPGS